MLTVASSVETSREQLIRRRDELLADLREVKFWLLVDRQPDGCWQWLGFRDRWGYGQFERNTKAHQQSYRYVNGPIPSGMVICHSCDNPSCVRPDHLFAGTWLDNSRDMAGKGRAHFQKVDRALYDDIRRAYAAGGVTQKELGDQFGLSQTQVSRIIGPKP